MSEFPYLTYYKFITMEQMLEAVIETGNPELIEKYVSKYIPNEPTNLQRIYNELNRYQPPQKEKIEPVAIRVIKTQKTKKILQTPLQNAISRTKSVMSLLKEKGLQVYQQNFQKGIQIVQKEKEKFLKPLKVNPISPFLKKGKIHELAKKYELNKQFYENPPVGFVKVVGFDPQMTQFIEKRKKLLKAIQEKKANLIEVDRPRKYKSVESKIKNMRVDSSNSNLLKLSSQQFISKQMLKKETKSIMEKCNKFQNIKIGSNEQNLFSELKERVDRLEDIDIDEALKTKVKENPVSEKLQRYNLPYMTYLKQKQDYRSMSSYKKELLKDQIKMRGIVNFQD